MLPLDNSRCLLRNTLIQRNFYFSDNKKHNWAPVKYLNILHHSRTKKQLQHFLIILQKCYQLPILGTLDMSGHFHQK